MEKYSPEELRMFLDFMKYQEGKASAEMAMPKAKIVRPKATEATHDKWTDDAGVDFWVHRWKPDCRNGCAIHAPSYHHMRDWPQIMRSSTLIERHCAHGWGHPDPDSLRFFIETNRSEMGVHGCDGCCTGQYDEVQNGNSI